MKIKIFLLLLSLGNLFSCFGQNNKITAIKRAFLTVSERVDELEKKGFKVRKTDISSIYSPLKIGANFKHGETVYIEAMIITDEKDKFSTNSEINVYCSQRDLSTKSASKDSLINKTLAS
jgi:hypothetical protein